jgi:hypothetical protein
MKVCFQAGAADVAAREFGVRTNLAAGACAICARRDKAIVKEL